MKAASYLLDGDVFVPDANNGPLAEPQCQLVLGFGEKQVLANPASYEKIRGRFPQAEIALCTTAGEIFDTGVYDDRLSLVAFQFEHTTIQSTVLDVSAYADSYQAGEALVQALPPHDLRHIFVLSDGGLVNGSELVRGMNQKVGHAIPITGGLAGDGARFVSTLVGLNEPPVVGRIVAIGFYGEHFRVSHGSMGGWDGFGLERMVTKSNANKLYEVDGKNALQLYKDYLGKYAAELPGSALLFPLSVKLEKNSEPVVRTILSIDDKNQCMIFAGDVPEGAKVRFMKANFDKLIEAATTAALTSVGDAQPGRQKVAILISCVGRKLILGERVEEEVEAVREALGEKVLLSGFYSYGEISPLTPSASCALHNQTMTITAFEEV